MTESSSVFQLGEFVIVRGEEGFGAAVLVDVFDHGPGEGEAVVGGGAASDLVEQDELRGVAVFRMAAVSVISTMKVERPRARLSEAPMRVKMRSTMREARAASAGTNDPICAMSAISAAWRR